VNAVGASHQCDGGQGYWNDTAIFITWDDWGGWYDHEPPTILGQPQGDYQYGFRVPLLVVSAYTPAGYIDNLRYDFGSILRFIERNYGLREGVLNFADARAANNLTTFFRAGAPRTFKTIPSPLDANYFINDTTPATDPDDY
jgi:phospholipase C